MTKGERTRIVPHVPTDPPEYKHTRVLGGTITLSAEEQKRQAHLLQQPKRPTAEPADTHTRVSHNVEWTPTMRLRWTCEPASDVETLEQLWISGNGDMEWRPVPQGIKW